jgi:hypothetical protein
MGTISTMEIGTLMRIGTPTTATIGIIAISETTPRGNSGTMLMVMLTLPAVHQLLKGENLVRILGEMVGDTILNTMHMNMPIYLTTIQSLCQLDPMMRSLHL